MEIIDRIFEQLSKSGMEQKEFALKVGISPSKISEWKSGKAKSYTKYLPQIAEALGTTVEYLATGKTPENAQTATPKGSGLTEEFAHIFESLTPENQMQIIAEMLKRQRAE